MYKSSGDFHVCMVSKLRSFPPSISVYWKDRFKFLRWVEAMGALDFHPSVAKRKGGFGGQSSNGFVQNSLEMLFCDICIANRMTSTVVCFHCVSSRCGRAFTLDLIQGAFKTH